MFNDLVNNRNPIPEPLITPPLEGNALNVLNQVPAAIAILKGPSFIIEMANPKAVEIWSKPYEEIINQPVFELFPELVTQGFDKILRQVYHSGEKFSANEAPIELIKHGRPETGYFNFSYDPYRNAQGEIIGIIATGIDITEQVKAKQGLIESNERSRMAIESAEMGTWDYNPETNNIICSDRTKELFGFRAEDNVTLEMAISAVVEKDKAKVTEAIQYAMTPASGGHYDVEYSLVNYYDKKQRTIKAKGKAFFKNGSVYRFIGTALDITQEVKSREEQKKLLTLVNNSVELMSILELDGKNSYINKAGMEMLGFENEQQVLKTPISALHNPEDIAFVETTVLPTVMSKGRWSGIMNVRHLKTGEIIPVFNNTIRIDDPATGQPMAIGAVMRDMRPELESQKNLSQSESKFRNVIEQAPYPILILKGEDMELEVANEALLELWNVDRTAIGKKFLEILPEMKGQGFMELLLDVYHNSKVHYGYEVPALFHRANGEKELVYFNFVYQPYKELEGQVTGVLVIATDVTGQVTAKRKLSKSETTLSLAVEAAQFGVFEVDMVKQKIVHSPKTAQIFGLNPSKQWPFKTFVDAVHPDDLLIRTKAHDQSLETGNLFYEVRVYWPDNSLHWVRLNGKVVVENGKAVSSVGTVIDITQEKKTAEILEEKIRQRTNELQEANENLERSNQQLEQFAHVASHDMKEPIRKIAMFTDRLKMELEPGLTPNAESYIQKMQSATSRLAKMIEGVLTYSSINASDEKSEKVNLKEVIKNVETDLELVIQQKHASIVYSDLPVINATPFLIHQLFYNLVNNSLKFSKSGTPSIIELNYSNIKDNQWQGYQIDPSQRYCEITLKDNGIGFSQENAENIFKTFTRLHSKDQYEGTGLGLALCRDIVEKHHGFIKAFGEDGEGAIFLILLPYGA